MTSKPLPPPAGFKRALMIVGGLLAVMWVIELVDWLGGRWLELDRFGYLLASGFVERSLVSVIMAVVVAGLYGSILWGVLPTNPGVSWEGHLFGLLAGGFIAFRWQPQRTELKQVW